MFPETPKTVYEACNPGPYYTWNGTNVSLQSLQKLCVQLVLTPHLVSREQNWPQWPGAGVAGQGQGDAVCLRTRFGHTAAPVPLAESLVGWSRGHAPGKAALSLRGTSSVFPAFTKDTQETSSWSLPGSQRHRF